MKFLHAADNHLDSPLRGLANCHEQSVNVEHKASARVLLRLWSYGKLEVEFEGLSVVKPFKSLRLRRRYRDKLISLFVIPDDDLVGRPSIEISRLSQSDKFEMFIAAQAWVVKRLDAERWA